MTEMSRLDLVARLLAALSLTIAFLAVGAAPAAAADAGGADDPEVVDGPVDTVGEVTCGVYGDVNPTAGAGSRCQVTYDELTEKPR